jgi:hypothetical protein
MVSVIRVHVHANQWVVVGLYDLLIFPIFKPIIIVLQLD